MLPVVILAGGLATRLHPISEKTPKSLIEVAGQPFIFHQLEYLRNQGITSITLCIGFLGEMVKTVVGDGSRWGLDIKYSMDGEKPLGTGGALRKAIPVVGEHFFVLYGDSYLPINFSEVEKKYVSSQKHGLMTVLKNNNQWDESNVEFDGNVIIEYNKSEKRPEMQYIDFGLGILIASVLQSYKSNQSFGLDQVYNKLSLSGDLIGYEVHERFYEIGSHQGIVETHNFLSKK